MKDIVFDREQTLQLLRHVADAKADERRRIRALIAPALREFRKEFGTRVEVCVCAGCKMIAAIDNATKAPRKGKAPG